jgi:hypothetical protein
VVHRSLRWSLLVAGVLALSVSIQPVSAVKNIVTSPPVGAWSFGDTPATPGAACADAGGFPGYVETYAIIVHPPEIHGTYAAEQYVGWKVTIQRKNVSGGSWTNYVGKPVQRNVATNSDPAGYWDWQDVVFTNEPFPGDRSYRAKVKLIWYALGSGPGNWNVEGWVTFVIEYYVHSTGVINTSPCVTHYMF